MKKKIKKKKIAAAAIFSVVVAVCLLSTGHAEDITVPMAPAIPEYFGDVQVTLSATDDDSGVENTYYQLDGGSWTTYTGPFVVTGSGNHIVNYYSVDNAGNTETTKTKEFIITYDSTPPTTSCSLVQIS